MADDAGAKARLEAAVRRLETALSRAAEQSGAGSTDAGEVDGLRRELEALDSDLTAARADRDRLAGELTQAKADGATLQAAMDAVSSRLDGAINSVHALLDE
jgi:predicted  nucleic acid-binding Zn-ribbon protein